MLSQRQLLILKPEPIGALTAVRWMKTVNKNKPSFLIKYNCTDDGKEYERDTDEEDNARTKRTFACHFGVLFVFFVFPDELVSLKL